jgi:putative lipase involved disintegration of autophagic bodies
MKASKVKPEVLCPACGYGMEKAVHVGKKRVSKDISDEDYASLFLDDEFDDLGDPNYIVSGGGRFG